MFLQGEGLALYKEYINDFPSIINSMNQWFSQSPHFKSLMGVSQNYQVSISLPYPAILESVLVTRILLLFLEHKFSLIQCHTSTSGAITTDTQILTVAQGRNVFFKKVTNYIYMYMYPCSVSVFRSSAEFTLFSESFLIFPHTQNLLKHTAMDHPDRQYLEAALYSLKNFLYIMNSDIEHASQFLNVARYGFNISITFSNYHSLTL